MLDAHQLNIFLTAAETLNFTEAAKRLHLTQPSVSQHIQALEKKFGADLFIRKGRQLELTGMGMTLLPLASELVRQSIQIEETMESLKGEVSGHLTVSCSTTPGKYVLPQLLAKFHNKYPRVKVTCNVTGEKQAMSMLFDGSVQFALSSATPNTVELMKAADFHNFICDPLVVIAPLDHPWAAQGTIQPEQLLEGTYIMREEGSGTYKTARDGLARVDIDINDLNVLLTLGNSEAIAIAVDEGIGVGFVSRIITTRLIQDKVAVVNVEGLDMCRDIYIGHQTQRPATIAQNAFWDFIHALEEDLYR